VSAVLFVKKRLPPPTVKVLTEVSRGLPAVPIPSVAFRASVPADTPDTVALSVFPLFGDTVELFAFALLVFKMAASDVSVSVPLGPVEMPPKIRSAPPRLFTLMFPFDVEAPSSRKLADVDTVTGPLGVLA
jgi:hypothetical protein